MPNYDYECPICDIKEERSVDSTDRDEQFCDTCYHKLKRKFTFKGAVWSPTRNGGYS